MLQWGHNFSVMEIIKMPKWAPEARQLQWGHNFSVMEIAFNTNSEKLKELASMGPQLFSYGNFNVL